MDEADDEEEEDQMDDDSFAESDQSSKNWCSIAQIHPPAKHVSILSELKAKK